MHSVFKQFKTLRDNKEPVDILKGKVTQNHNMHFCPFPLSRMWSAQSL